MYLINNKLGDIDDFWVFLDVWLQLLVEKSSSQRDIDRNVQDIEQLNLKHQLEIKVFIRII